MDCSLTELCRFFSVAKYREIPLTLATVLRTEGSTYRKAGAAILIGADGSSGMLSGGCLEADLRERAARVLARGRPERVWFDSRTGDDPLFDLGLGCEGAMDVWLQPVRPAAPDGPLHYFTECLDAELRGGMVTVVGGEARAEELGRQAFAPLRAPAAGGGDTAAAARPGAGPDPLGAALTVCVAQLHEAAAGAARLRTLAVDGRNLEVFAAPVALPPNVLICGAGPDAIPVQRFASALGWRVTVYDHRPAYTETGLFPGATRVLLGRPGELRGRLDPSRFDAVVVMSHHLPSDAEYLRAMSASPPAYIGLLGPPARRRRLLADAGASAHEIAARIHAPVGLDIGAGSPESIALAIVAHIHAVLAGRPGGAFPTGG